MRKKELIKSIRLFGKSRVVYETTTKLDKSFQLGAFVRKKLVEEIGGKADKEACLIYFLNQLTNERNKIDQDIQKLVGKIKKTKNKK